MKYKIHFIKKENIADGTMSFYFEKPVDFTYKAGQTIDLTLINPPTTDAEGNTRTFSLITIPSESLLAIATRIRDTAFKQTLKNMIEGTEVSIEGPLGSFTLHQKSERPAVFLAGGIGITPFRSIILDATEKKLPHKLYLFYSNRRPEDTAFLNDFITAQKSNSNFTFIGTMTDMEKPTSHWTGEIGYITYDMIKKYHPDTSTAIFYLAGPQTMVTAMRKLLHEGGISDDDIRIEEFAGY